jgi:ABC-type branched-subunit amino acid transport system ATPase component
MLWLLVQRRRHDPKVMLLDEPSVALSPVAVGAMVNALLELRKRVASLSRCEFAIVFT